MGDEGLPWKVEAAGKVFTEWGALKQRMDSLPRTIVIVQINQFIIIL